MFQGFIDNLIAKLTGGLPEEKEGIDLEDILSLIAPEVGSHSIYIKTKNGSQILYSDPESKEHLIRAKGICVVYEHEGVKPWETEAPARHMCEKLGEVLNSKPVVLLNRDPESFAGYYVYIKSL